ncbi:MAG: ABC transporter permease [Spirochaetota bacterium]
MIKEIIKFLKTRELILTWTNRILKARYQQSVLGGLWMVIQPVASVLVLTIVFTFFIPVDTGKTPYLVFSYAALVPWYLLTGALNDMAGSMVENMQLITKIYFPREILPFSAMLARLVDFLVAYGILFGLILYYKIQIVPIAWLFLPLILSVQIILMFGLGLALSAMNVFFRDVKPLLGLVIQIWFYASPIIYPLSMIPERFRSFYFLNPMAGILESYRAVLIHGTLPGPYLLFSAAIAVLVFVAGYWFFKRVEFQFADII